MTKSKNLMDSMIETSSKTVNNWMETARKAQKAAISGQSLEKNSDLYKEWLSNQMSIFRNISLSSDKEESKAEEKSSQPVNEATEYFQNWYKGQLDVFKQMTDFNQNLWNGMMNFGKPANEVNHAFEQMNKAWTSIYDNWTGTLQNTFNHLNSFMQKGTQKEAFEGIFQAQQTFLKLQEFYQPFLKSMQNGTFNPDAMKKMFEPEAYKNLLENMFGMMFPKENMKNLFEMYARNVHNQMGLNQEVSKEWMTNFQHLMSQYPNLFTGDVSKMIGVYNQISDAMEKTLSPYMNLMSPGKEKERMQRAMDTLDKIAVYNIKNAQLQYLIYNTGVEAIEKSVEMVSDKFKNQSEVTSFQKFYQEWVNLNETTFLQLFNSDDFSALKAEVMSLSLSIKKDLENQMEEQMSFYPFVPKSDMKEVYQLIHDLKQKVKTLETKLAAHSASTVELDEEDVKPSRSSRKK